MINSYIMPIFKILVRTLIMVICFILANTADPDEIVKCYIMQVFSSLFAKVPICKYPE